MPQAGELTESIDIKEAVETIDSAGGTIVDWSSATTVASPRAKIEPLRGQEALDLGFKEASLHYRIWILYRSGILPKHRVFWGTIELDIISARPFRGEKVWTEIMATEHLIS